MGAYVVNAKFYIRAENAGTYTWLANCTLADGADSDFSQAEGHRQGATTVTRP